MRVRWMRYFMTVGMLWLVRSVRGSWSFVRFVGRALGGFVGFGGPEMGESEGGERG